MNRKKESGDAQREEWKGRVERKSGKEEWKWEVKGKNGSWKKTLEKDLKTTASISGFVFPITTQRPASAAAALRTREAEICSVQGEKAG
ncbi:hypothetical protein MSMTP_1616 [Methanosarcina sp. MTP4]|nr:hypothetical protein MSMTP_1616 [Methanosarcina sp. MTP4]